DLAVEKPALTGGVVGVVVAAQDAGYDPPSGHITVAITSPGIDVYGFGGGAFLGENTSAGLMAHEVGHGMGLAHSFSNDPDYKNASWAAFGVYDDPWDVMSYANVFSIGTGMYGLAPPGPNAYHRDRMGWLRRDKILRFGADGRAEETVTLRALSQANGSGYHLVRIPFDPADPFRYFTVEYRVEEDWDAGIPQDVVLVHEVKERDEGQYRSYLLRSGILPVIIAGPPSFRGNHPGVPRLRRLRGDVFDVRFQEWDYREREHGDIDHREERIPYLVVEPGRHRMADGSVWEAGVFRLDDTEHWVSERFEADFAARPRLYLTVQTQEGDQAVTVRARNVSASGFEAALFEEEALNDGHVEEVVGYLAIHSSSGDGQAPIGGLMSPYAASTERVDERWSSVGGRTQIHLDEEESSDTETAHVHEDIDILDLGSRIFAQPVSVNGTDTISPRHRRAPAMEMEAGGAEADENWTGVSLGAGQTEPVVIAGPPSFRGSDPGIARLRRVTSDGFELRFQEWDYREREADDTNHLTERIPYLAVDAGRHSLSDGSQWEAGSFRLDGTRDWKSVSFEGGFPARPRLISDRAVRQWRAGDRGTRP
ncbi:MAG: hypothetical protein WDZ60_09640, partial [Wenzhouxiangellaceae bacterium]